MANLVVIPANVQLLDKGTALPAVTAGAAITAGSSVSRGADNKWQLGIASIEAQAGNIDYGIACNSSEATDQPLYVARDGSRIDFGAGVLLAGWWYMISNTPGAIAEISDSVSGQYATILGYAETDAIFHVKTGLFTGVVRP